MNNTNPSDWLLIVAVLSGYMLGVITTIIAFTHPFDKIIDVWLDILERIRKL
jgi:hypothetical protein